MNYYKEIKTKLIENENYAKIKDYSKERYKVQTYFEVGKILCNAGTEYGENIIGQYAEKLQTELGKKYSERTLRRMRQLYQSFNNEKWSPLVTKLSWSHYIVLMTLEDTYKIGYYLETTQKFNLSKRELEERIKNKEYERLDEQSKLKLSGGRL